MCRMIIQRPLRESNQFNFETCRANREPVRFLDYIVTATDLKSRLVERDRQLAADTRTEAERWLGDPPPWRAALAQHNKR